MWLDPHLLLLVEGNALNVDGKQQLLSCQSIKSKSLSVQGVQMDDEIYYKKVRQLVEFVEKLKEKGHTTVQAGPDGAVRFLNINDNDGTKVLYEVPTLSHRFGHETIKRLAHNKLVKKGLN
jgi:hypothetical protein